MKSIKSKLKLVREEPNLPMTLKLEEWVSEKTMLSLPKKKISSSSFH